MSIVGASQTKGDSKPKEIGNQPEAVIELERREMLFVGGRTVFVALTRMGRDTYVGHV